MNTVKGFQDFLGEDAKKRERMIELIRNQFKLFGFEPAETPIIENEDFVRGKNKNDEAVRDLFSLKDRGERNLALRFEFTFQLKRIMKNQKLPYKRYQIGYVFRDEPIRKGRLRQFIQCDADIIGSTLKEEAELLSMAKQIYLDLKIPSKIYINNRKLINEIFEEEKIPERIRDQVMRELDKLDKLTREEVARNLKKLGAEKILDIFIGVEKSFEKYKYYREITDLKKLCEVYGVSVEFRPYLARGLSYYNGTVFEIWSDKLNVALSGGGSFLVNDTQSTGLSFGIEPLFLISEIDYRENSILILSISEDKQSINLAKKIRDKGISTILLLDKSPTKALEYSNSKKIKKVIIVGEEEVRNKKYTLKNMETGKSVKLSERDLIEGLSNND